MDWDKALKFIADAAPLLGKLLPIPGAGIAGDLIASAFGTKNNKDAIAAAIAADPQAAMKLRELEMNNRAVLQGQLIQAETVRIQAINKTIQTEITSNDRFVRRWRPMFGYIVGFAWGGQVVLISVAILYVAITAPVSAQSILGGIAEIMGSMVVMWSVALSVLGVSVKKRSDDKALAAGQQPGGLVKTLIGKLGGKAK